MGTPAVIKQIQRETSQCPVGKEMTEVRECYSLRENQKPWDKKTEARATWALVRTVLIIEIRASTDKDAKDTVIDICS